MKIRRCKFCRGSVRIVEGMFTFKGQCNKCAASTACSRTEDGALAEWNTATSWIVWRVTR